MTNYTCPVCGFNGLEFKPYSNYLDPATGYLEYCPSCGFQFGVHDLAKGNWSWRKWRIKWINEGMKWNNENYEKPKNWNSKIQLKNIGIDIGKPNWKNLESQFSLEGKFLGVIESKQ